MRLADLVVAGVLALLSIYLMVKSAELPIGWLPGEGPGGGAFPFWLALGMLICSVLIFARTLLRLSPEGKATGLFMDKGATRLFLIVLVSLSIMIGLIEIVGVYVSVPLFMIFYLRYLGGHSWWLTGFVAVATPVVTFILFEKILLILLPKGITDPLFYVFF
jgi:hypothetical protein